MANRKTIGKTIFSLLFLSVTSFAGTKKEVTSEEFLNVFLKPLQSVGIDSDLSKSQELEKLLTFIMSGNKIVKTYKEEVSPTITAYVAINKNCMSGRTPCNRGSSYTVLVENKNGTTTYKSLRQSN